MKVHWTDTAVEHLAKIHAYIAQDSPAYASRVVDRLTRRSKQIGRFPNSGRVVPESDHPQVREVIEGAYRSCLSHQREANRRYRSHSWGAAEPVDAVAWCELLTEVGGT